MFHLTLPLPLYLWPPYAIAFWGVYVWSRQGERRVLQRDAPEVDDLDDKGSWRVIDLGSKIARAAAVLAAFVLPAWLPGWGRLAIYLAGVLLMLGGALLRRYCFKLLGEFFTFQVKVGEDHAIIESGVYRRVRHPSYTGGMMYNLGIGLALTNPVSLALMAIWVVVAYTYRVRVEERALLKVHGASYADYMKRTTRFIPFVV